MDCGGSDAAFPRPEGVPRSNWAGWVPIVDRLSISHHGFTYGSLGGVIIMAILVTYVVTLSGLISGAGELSRPIVEQIPLRTWGELAQKSTATELPR